MSNDLLSDDDDRFPATIQHSLQEMATQLGQTLDGESAATLYQQACDLLDHLSYASITLARVAGTLLVYHWQEAEPEELAWFKSQIKQCPNDEEVEELIESLHRTDAL